LPILKRQQHQQALVKAATSGNPKFFLGTDSAPHAVEKKEAACGCAGCYTAPVAIELYAEAFEKADALHRLEDFASSFGADFYGLPRSTTTITLQKSGQRIPENLPFGSSRIKPLQAGEEISWRLATGK
jgi:dihydroorotase